MGSMAIYKGIHVMYKGNQVIFEGIFSKYIKESAEGSMQHGIPWSFMGGNELTMTIE